MAKTYILNQEVLFFTSHFGKDYVWLRDVDGTCYMMRFEDGQVQWT